MPNHDEDQGAGIVSDEASLRREFLTALEAQLALVEHQPLWLSGAASLPEGSWWWCDEEGNILLTLKFRSAPLRLANGKSTAIVQSVEELRWLLHGISIATKRGCLDLFLTNAAIGGY